MADEPPMPGADRRREIQTTRLLKRAIKRGWNIPPEKLAEIMARQTELAVSLPPGREQQAAVESVLAMNQQDLELTKIVVRHDEAQAGPTDQAPTQVVIVKSRHSGGGDGNGSQ